MALYAAIAFIIVAFYSISVFTFAYGLAKLKRAWNPSPKQTIPVSILIPVRNEGPVISRLLGDLAEQTYPGEMFEVIFVNDHSIDDSRAVIDSFIDGRTGFNLLHLSHGEHGKKAALSLGVSSAAHEWIIQVDADCRIGPDFITAHMTFLEAYPSDLVAGLVTTGRGSGGFLESFERLDLLSLAGVSAGSFYYRRPMMCSGANLAYSRELYRETRPFDPIEKIASGDDMFLMIGARKLGKKLSFNPAREAMVETRPVKSLRLLFKQRIRWGTKSIHYKMPDIQLLAFLVTITNLVILSLPIWIVGSPGFWPWALGIWGIKTFADFSILVGITKYTDQQRALYPFLLVSLVYFLYFPSIIIGSLFKQSGWKESDPAAR